MIEIFIAPIIILIMYIYIRDKYEKEPYMMCITSLIIGAILSSVILNIENFFMENLYLIEENIMNLIGIINSNAQEVLSNDVRFEIIIISFLVAAFSEEIVKFIFFYFSMYKNREFNEPFDGIVYSSFIALGFAQVENLVYYFNLVNVLDTNVIYQIGVRRAISAAYFHLVYGIYMGYFAGRVKFPDIIKKEEKKDKENKDKDKKDKEKKIKKDKVKENVYINKTLNVSLSFIIPFLVHGLYDYLALSIDYSNKKYLLYVYVFLIFNLILSSICIKKSLDKSPFKNKISFKKS